MGVPLLNLKRLHDRHRADYLAAIASVMDDAAFVGPSDFERRFAGWVLPGSHAVGCANGTDAIRLAALALGLPPGSEAVVPAMTYVGTVEGLLGAGLSVRLADITEGTWTLDPAAIDGSPRVLVPVHLYGQMAAVDELRALAPLVLEDAAQAHGARWNDHPVGYYGDIAAFSFYPGKNLGAFGDGGAVLSRNSALVERCRALGNHGGVRKYEHELIGFNSRLDRLQAAVLDVKLAFIDDWNEARRAVARQYGEWLRDIPGLTLPSEARQARHVFHQYVVLVEKREEFRAFLAEHGIETGVHYPRAIHQQPCFRSFTFARERFPVAEKLAAHGVSLPMDPLLNPAEVEAVAGAVRRYFRRSP